MKDFVRFLSTKEKMCVRNESERERWQAAAAGCVGAARGQLGRLRLRRASPARIAGVGLGTNRGALSSAATRPASQPASEPSTVSQCVVVDCCCSRCRLASLSLSLLLSAGESVTFPFFARADCFRTLFRIAVATKVGAGRRAKVAQAAHATTPDIAAFTLADSHLPPPPDANPRHSHRPQCDSVFFCSK
jgi:hypothetical protein